MPLRDYSTKAGYDADYRFRFPAQNFPLPAARLRFEGLSLTDLDGSWTRPKVGGFLHINPGPGTPRSYNRTQARILDIVGNEYKLSHKQPWLLHEATVVNEAIKYLVPQIEMRYDAPFFRHPELGVQPTVEKYLTKLNVAKAENILIVGAGMGFEVEAAHRLGYTNCIGVDDGAFVSAALGDTEGELEDWRARLRSAGLDPTVGEGLALMQEWSSIASIRSADNLVLVNGLSTPQELNEVRGRFSGNIEWVISSFVLSILHDAEAVALDAKMHNAGRRVAHYTPMLPGNGSERVGDNWKTLSEWQTLLPNSIIVPVREYGSP